MATAVCEWKDSYQGSYLETAIFIPIFIMLHTLLLFHTIYNNMIRKRITDNTKQSLQILFIIQITSALIWLISDFLRFVIDPTFIILQDNFLCVLTSVLPRLCAFVYYGSYASLILHRLRISFKGSFLQIQTSHLYILSLFIILPEINLPILLVLWMEPPCIWKWKPWDIQISQSENFSICSFRNVDKANTIIIVGVIWIAVTNLIFGGIFALKLNKVLHLNQANNNSKNQNQQIWKLKSLVVKTAILCIFGATSTILNWTLWSIQENTLSFAPIFIYFDLFANNVCVCLMFNSNEIYYKKLCKICIKFCLITLDKGYDHNKEEEVERRRCTVTEYLSCNDVLVLESDHVNNGNVPNVVEMMMEIDDMNTLNLSKQKSFNQIQQNIIIRNIIDYKEYETKPLPPINLTPNSVQSVASNSPSLRSLEKYQEYGKKPLPALPKLKPLPALPIKERSVHSTRECYVCVYCKEKIFDEWVKDSRSRMYHKQCFMCSGCGISLVNQIHFVNVIGGNVCKICNNKYPH